MEKLKLEMKKLEEQYNKKIDQLYQQSANLFTHKTQKNAKDIEKKMEKLHQKIEKHRENYNRTKQKLRLEIQKIEIPLIKTQFTKVHHDKIAQKDILKQKFKKSPDEVRTILKKQWQKKKSACANPKVVLHYEHFNLYPGEWESVKKTFFKYPKDLFPISQRDLKIPIQKNIILYQDVEGLKNNLEWIKKQQAYLQDLLPNDFALVVDYSVSETNFIGVKKFFKQKRLASIINNAPPLEADLLVYRGITNDYFPKKDNMFLNKRFISTTYALHAAFNFMGDFNCCLLQILLPKGTRCLFMPIVSVYPDECEILLPITTIFKISSKDMHSLNDSWTLGRFSSSYPFEKDIIKASIPSNFKSFIYKYFGLTL